MQAEHMSGALIIDRDSTRIIVLEELTGRDAAEVALVDLAFSDDEWMDEQETTEYTEPAWLLEEFDARVLDKLIALEPAHA
jgi:hypothetical protein